jgi:diadenosine tetraphosphate (Ap4A) HIT family hydrolase
MPIELPQQERCNFCRMVTYEAESVCVDDVDGVFAFLNPRQFGKGHVLVISKRHAPTVLDLESHEAIAVM